MISVATSLGVSRPQATHEMQQILNLEKALANVGETFDFLIVSPLRFASERDGSFHINDTRGRDFFIEDKTNSDKLSQWICQL